MTVTVKGVCNKCGAITITHETTRVSGTTESLSYVQDKNHRCGSITGKANKNQEKR